MRLNLALVLACSTMALATAANAQSSSSITVDGQAYSQYTVDNNFNNGPFTMPDTKTVAGAYGTNYSSMYSINSQAITFESASTAVGTGPSSSGITTTSVSRIDMGITSNSDGYIAPKILSQITPAEMGIYIADNANGSCFTSPTSCIQSRGTEVFSDFVGAGGPNTLASVSFDMKVVQQNYGEDSPSTLYEVSGGLELDVDGHLIIFNNTDQAAGLLTGFTTLDKFGILTDGTSNSALAFSWAPTDISAQLNPIYGYGSSTLSYIVTVTSTVNAPCINDGNTCLLAFSGFGDPIGQGGAIDSNLQAFDLGGPMTFNDQQDQDPPIQYIDGLHFSPYQLAVPGFDNDGNINLTPGGVPEPATWGLMTMGFGALGAALRRRRSAVAVA